MAGGLGANSVIEVLSVALRNVIYLAVRCSDAGVDQGVLFRSIAYLLLAALHVSPLETTVECSRRVAAVPRR